MAAEKAKNRFTGPHADGNPPKIAVSGIMLLARARRKEKDEHLCLGCTADGNSDC